MVICKTKMNCYLDQGGFESMQFGIPQYFRNIAEALFHECITTFRNDGDIEAFVFQHGYQEIAFVRKEYIRDWLCFIESDRWIPQVVVELYEREQESLVEWKAVAAEYSWEGVRTQRVGTWDGKNKSEQEIAREIRQYFKEDDS